MSKEIEQAVDRVLEQGSEQVDFGPPPPAPEEGWPPLDTSTPETWADSIVKIVKHVSTNELGYTHTGEPYLVNDFIFDTFCGDMPSTEEENEQVWQLIQEHPEFEAARDAFMQHYGVDPFAEASAEEP